MFGLVMDRQPFQVKRGSDDGWMDYYLSTTAILLPSLNRCMVHNVGQQRCDVVDRGCPVVSEGLFHCAL